jgi:DeoR family suf operon transcriptional repressor
MASPEEIGSNPSNAGLVASPPPTASSSYSSSYSSTVLDWATKTHDQFAWLLLGDSKRKIMKFLVEGDRTADGIASILNMNVSAVRKHMEALRKCNLVSYRFERATLGRPKKIYSITDQGRNLLSQKYDVFLASLLGKMSSLNRDFAMEVMESLANDIAKDLKEALPKRKRVLRRQEKLEQLVEVLNEIGFSARLEKTEDGKSPRIVRTNCAVLKVAKTHPDLVCKVFDTTFLRAFLGREDVSMVESMGCGARHCVHLV